MVKFNFLPCDVFPILKATCSIYEFNAEIIYPSSYGDIRTSIQKRIETLADFKENFPVINIGPIQLRLRKGYIVYSITLYFKETKKEVFTYEDNFGSAPLIALSMQNIDTEQDDLYFNEQVSVKIDKDNRVIYISFGKRENISQTFSLADNLMIHADKDNNLLAMVFRNFQWIDIETEPSIPLQHKMMPRSLFFRLTQYVRNLF